MTIQREPRSRLRRRRPPAQVRVLLCLLGLVGSTFLLTSELVGRSPVVVRVGVALPYGADPRIGLTPAAQSLQSEYLGAIAANGRINPRVAERWSRSVDGRDWTFWLAPKLRFQDGVSVTAQDVVRMLSTQLKDQFQLLFHPRLRDVVGLDILGDREILVRTNVPRVLTLDDLTDLPLRQSSTGLGLAAFVSGPVTENGFTARAAPGYFRGRGAIDVVEFRSHRSLRAAWAALMRDEIDALYEVNRDAVEFVEREQRVKVYPFLRPYVATLVFNVRTPQLARAEVRRGLSRIIDREAIVRAAYRGRARAAQGPLWPNHWLLKSLSGVGQNPVPEHGRPLDLQVRCLVVPELEQQPFERLALVLQKQFADAGVDLELEAVTMKDLARRLPVGDFEAVLLEAIGGAPTWMYGMWHSPVPGTARFITTGYTGADKELDAMQMARDDEELKRAVAAVYRKMDDDPPAIFIAWPEVARAVSTRFDVPVEKGVDIMGGNLWLWRPAKR